MYITRSRILSLINICLILALDTVLFMQNVSAAQYVFPVVGPSNFSNDFNAPRSNGTHHAIDIFANKHQKIVSRTDGVVTFVGYPQPDWGYAVFIRADNGYSYNYLHLNNDNPGTDNGNGGAMHAYAPDIEPGKRVVMGQHIGYVGDSGNAETTPPHLHFEAYNGNQAINPYDGLVNNSVYRKSTNDNYPKHQDEILPNSMGSNYRGNTSVAVGNVSGNESEEIISGPGKNAYYVNIFNTQGVRLGRFMPNGKTFNGGVDVAVGDVNDDGVDEIITGTGSGGRYVKVFNASGEMLARFLPNGPNFYGGVDVAVGDINGDGVGEIITGAGPGGRYVKAFTMEGEQIARFVPYGSFSGGISVSSGDITGDSADEIITGARRGGGPRVSIFTIDGTLVRTYYAYNTTFKGGIRVEAANIATNTAKDEIITISQQDGTARAKVFSPSGSSLGFSDYFAEVWWQGHYDIAATDEGVFSGMGVKRRSTLRPVEF